jgi:hypothetical protein
LGAEAKEAELLKITEPRPERKVASWVRFPEK